ncbi:MFS transporter [Candidatus Chlorohelix sp.]|uniref:MFS transporter n=1 Tax=Candidatus Chlorohelix sp. TaxID=3139201 RepID=UPI00303BEEE9
MKIHLSGLWRKPDFMKLWTGQMISEFGSRITREGLPYAAVLVLAASPAELGFLTALTALPVLLVGLIAGVLVDRVKRRPVMIWCDIGRFLLVGSIPVAALFGLLTMWQLYVVALLVGTFTIFFEVASQSYLPSLVERENLVEGNSKLGASSSLAEICGPPLAGVLVQTLTAPIAMAFDAISYLFSALGVGLIRKPETKSISAHHEFNFWREVREGLAVVLSNPYLRPLAINSAISNFFGSFIGTFYVYYAVNDLKLEPGILGFIIGLGGIGALLGTLLATPTLKRLGLGNSLLVALFLGKLVPFLIPLAGGLPWLVIVCMALPQLLGDATMMVFLIHSTSLCQSVVPDRLLGRANASMQFLIGAISPIGPLAAGFLGSWLGVRLTLLIALVGMLSGGLAVIFSPLRTLREFPTMQQETSDNSHAAYSDN